MLKQDNIALQAEILLADQQIASLRKVFRDTISESIIVYWRSSYAIHQLTLQLMLHHHHYLPII